MPVNKYTRKPINTTKYNVDATTGVVEPVKEERFVDNSASEMFEDESTIDTHSVDDTNKSDVFEEATNVTKKTTNISIERYVAILLKHSLRVGTAWLFKPYNAMSEEEASSTAVPTIRMFQRRIEKKLKVALPFDRMDKQDKADIEEVVTAVGNYLIRISAAALDRMIARITKQNRPVQPRPLNDHEVRVMQSMQRMKQASKPNRVEDTEIGQDIINNHNGMSVEEKQALLTAIGSDLGLEG